MEEEGRAAGVPGLQGEAAAAGLEAHDGPWLRGLKERGKKHAVTFKDDFSH